MVINTRFWALSLWATQACRRRRTPAIVLEHGSGYLSLGGRVVDLAVRAYEHVALWWVRHYCQLFYGVSEATCDWLRQLGVSPQGVLYNAVDVAAVTGLAARCDWDVRDDLGLDPATPVIAFAGRLIAGKGINELVAAMAMVRQTRPDAVLVAAGDGPLLESLNDASKPGVIFLGALPHERTLALIQQSDVFCLPTYSEGFSTVILEAAALGACIVTTPVGGTPELIASPTAGVLLEDVRPATIATALHRVLGDKAWRQQAGAECQARVEAAFTWERTANAVLGIAKALAPDNFEGEATTPRH
jgi:glycosyltransferase involved in cell wall biosynthesis